VRAVAVHLLLALVIQTQINTDKRNMRGACVNKVSPIEHGRPIPDTVELGDVVVDLLRGEIRDRSGREQDIRPRSMQVLAHLVRNAGRVVTKDELLAVGWPDLIVTEDSLTQAIADCRRAVGDTDKKLIRTVARQGYLVRIERPDAALGPETGSAPAGPGAGPAGLRRLGPFRTRAGAALALGLALVLVVVAAVLLRPDQVRSTPVLAVLPFKAMVADGTDAYFTEGLTENLIVELARFPDIRVVSRNSSFRFAAGDDPREVMGETGARYVLTGSVQFSGDKLRIAA
jgi:hypothetical protein